jgi:hypothetical protein
VANQFCRPEGELRQLAREEIQGGRLPQSLSLTMWGGQGSGLPCVVCGEAIPRDQVEYEVADPRGGESLLFHLLCHTVWQLECHVGIQAGFPAIRAL